MRRLNGGSAADCAGLFAAARRAAGFAAPATAFDGRAAPALPFGRQGLAPGRPGSGRNL